MTRGVKEATQTAMITAGLMKALTGSFPQIEFVDVTDDFDLIKALKSDEEMGFIRETARVQDEVWAALPAIVKPGMMEYQAQAGTTASQPETLLLGSPARRLWMHGRSQKKDSR